MSFPAILALEDGSIFYGDGFGEEKIEVGEIVFNTSMTGYQEIITDPSYKKQIITKTNRLWKKCPFNNICHAEAYNTYYSDVS